jgi:hypothetical protein
VSWPDLMTPWATGPASTAGPRDLDDAAVLEVAALVLLRRYPGTRPDGLEATIANLQWIVRAIRRRAAAATPDQPDPAEPAWEWRREYLHEMKD